MYAVSVCMCVCVGEGVHAVFVCVLCGSVHAVFMCLCVWYVYVWVCTP